MAELSLNEAQWEYAKHFLAIQGQSPCPKEIYILEGSPEKAKRRINYNKQEEGNKLGTQRNIAEINQIKVVKDSLSEHVMI